MLERGKMESLSFIYFIVFFLVVSPSCGAVFSIGHVMLHILLLVSKSFFFFLVFIRAPSSKVAPVLVFVCLLAD